MFPWRSLLVGSLLTGVALGDDTLRRLIQPQAIEDLARGFDPATLATGLAHREAHLRDASDPVLADETLRLLAPLADRMGLPEERARLEDASFRLVQPDAFASLDASGAHAEQTLAGLHDDTRRLLADHGLRGQVTGRVKSHYSTWRKMQRKGLPAAQIYDRVALRVIADDEGTLRRVLDLLHARHSPVPGEFDDYILAPKPSGYQALHTAVHTRHGVAEFQLRTPAMDRAAESGAQAHWRYKLQA